MTVLETAVWILGKLGSDIKAQIMPNLPDMLNDPDNYVVSCALVGLRGLGGNAKAALPRLQQLLDDKNKKLNVENSAFLRSENGIQKSGHYDIGELGPAAKPLFRL